MALRYSTGPMENTTSTRSETVTVKALNNSRTRTATVRVNVYGLNGTKNKLFTGKLVIPPQSSDFFLDIPVEVPQFEVEFIIRLDGANDQGIFASVVPSVWGKDARGRLNPVHRVLTSELHLQESLNWFN